MSAATRATGEGGAARRKGRGLPTGAKRRRPKAGLHKRSAEDWGCPLRRARAAPSVGTEDMVYTKDRRHRLQIRRSEGS